MRRTAVRFLGGDYRRALPEFDALAGHLLPHLQTHQQKRGVLLSRPGPALRAERGQATVAQVKFEAALRQVKAMEGDARDEAVELRCTNGFLELSQERLDRPSGYSNRSMTTCAWSTAPTMRTWWRSPRPWHESASPSTVHTGEHPRLDRMSLPGLQCSRMGWP